MNFKVGDKVVVASNSVFTHRIGQVGEIVEIHPNYKYSANVKTRDGIVNWMDIRELRKLSKLEKAMK